MPYSSVTAAYRVPLLPPIHTHPLEGGAYTAFSTPRHGTRHQFPWVPWRPPFPPPFRPTKKRAARVSSPVSECERFWRIKRTRQPVSLSWHREPTVDNPGQQRFHAGQAEAA